MRTITYWLTRDTNCNGQLSSVIDAWHRKPIRHKLGFPNGYTWLPSRDPAVALTEVGDIGYYGAYSLEHALAYFKTIPDDDRQCIVCEQDIPEKRASEKAQK